MTTPETKPNRVGYEYQFWCADPAASEENQAMINYYGEKGYRLTIVHYGGSSLYIGMERQIVVNPNINLPHDPTT